MFSVHKFHEWLTENEITPWLIKIKVLYSCLFSSIMYSCETWGDTAKISNELLQIERKLLKRILGVKQGTSDNIVYFECDHPTIIGVIKDRQYSFFKKICELSSEDTSLNGILNLYTSLIGQNQSVLEYYCSLQDGNKTSNKEEIKIDLRNSTATMCERYVALTDLQKTVCLYSSMHDDSDRQIITRWRLSSHPLYIETGRYKRPYIERHNRKCIVCSIIEDEDHALFKCNAHQFIRIRYDDLIQKYTNVKDMLNPLTPSCIQRVAKYLREIEENMKYLNMLH